MQTRIFKRAPQVSGGGMKSMRTGETQKYIRMGGEWERLSTTADTEGAWGLVGGPILPLAGRRRIMGTVRHILLGSLAALVGATIAISLHSFGAHDIEGFFAAVAGYPGLLANGKYTRPNEVLFTAVTWLFYLGLFEAVVVMKRKLSH
jgi:hypothetical protein